MTTLKIELLSEAEVEGYRMFPFRPFCDFDRSYQYRDNWEELHTLQAVYDFMHLPTAYMRGPQAIWVSFDDFPREPLSYYMLVPRKKTDD